jgi:hypothetical protein
MSEPGRFPEPKIAIDVLSKKVNAPADRWDDLKRGEHALTPKVTMSEGRIRHAFRQKDGAAVPEDCTADAYQALQEPDFIYEEKKARHGERARRILFSKRGGMMAGEARK